MEKLSACFGGQKDPRDDNACHNLLEILVIAFATILCGGQDCSDMALFGRAKGLSRDWGDNADSDTICRARRQWGIADAVGFGAGWNPGRWSDGRCRHHGVQPTRLS